jgi:hypothetical protein
MGRLRCFGVAVITPESKVNALALCQAKRFEVKYINRDRYVVRVSDELTLEFVYCDEDATYMCIYDYDADNALQRVETQCRAHHATVSANESKYSKTEVIGAKMASGLLRKLYYPSYSYLVKLIANGRL